MSEELGQRPRGGPGGWAEPVPGFGRWLHDFTDDTWSWSPEMIAMFDAGLTNPGDVGVILERLHPDDREQVRRAVQHATRTGEPLHGLYRFRTDTRGERVFAFFGDPIHIGRDTVVSLRGYTIDVTEQVHAVARELVREAQDSVLGDAG